MKKTSKGIWTLVLALIGGLLGAWAGADRTSKAWRRFVLPAVITLVAWLYLRDWDTLYVLTMCIPLTFGYGIPEPVYDSQGRIVGYKDEGSTLGKFWFKITDGNHKLTDYLTRGTIGALIGLALIPIPIIKGNWWYYIVGTWVIQAEYVLVSWRSLPSFVFLGKKLTMSEFITYTTVTVVAMILIFFGSV